MTTPVIQVQEMYCTPGVLEITSANEAHHLEAVSAVHKILAGDWGLVDSEEQETNNRALRDGSRIIGAYTVAGERMWIIVEAGEAMTEPARRPLLTILLPSEY